MGTDTDDRICRRELLALLVAASAVGAKTSLETLFESVPGTAIVLDVRTRRLIAAHRPAAAAAELSPPGSCVKPFVLQELLRAGRLAPGESFVCPGELLIAGRSFACSHPAIASPMRVPTALAYSCNCFVAHFAGRLQPGQLARGLARAGLGSRTGLFPREALGRIPPAEDNDANRLQALGEQNVLVTAAELAMGYRALASTAAQPNMDPILTGLEGAVEYGTAQRAQVEGLRVAGKTGSVRNSSGLRLAWFSGFAPSRAPEVVVTVMVQGYSGGADAAPVAARILRAWRGGQL